MAESKKKLKSLLVKDESENIGLKPSIQKTKIMASSPITSWQIDGETTETVIWLYFGGLQNHYRWLQNHLQPWNLKMLAPWKRNYGQPRQHIKKQRHYFANKGLSSQNYGFSSSHVQMWDLNHKESLAPKNCSLALWCWRRLLRVPWTAGRLKPVNPKVNQPWVFIGRTDAEVEAPILWPPEVKSWLISQRWCWKQLKADGEGDDTGWDG